MAGTADLMAALAGGSRLENASYSASVNRLMDAANKQSMMDKRVLEANLIKDQMRARGNLERNPGNLDTTTLYAILADVADQLKAGREAVGVDQTNQAQQSAIDVAKQIQGSGAGLPDILNAFISAGEGKLQGPTNILVEEQALADIGHSEALANQANAGAKEKAAQAIKALRGDPTTPTGAPIGKSLTEAQLEVLLGLPMTETVMVDNPYWFTGDSPSVQEIPSDDPRRFELQTQFFEWQAKRAKTDPTIYADPQRAMGEFISEYMARIATEPAATGAEAQDQRKGRTVYTYNPETGKVSLKQ